MSIDGGFERASILLRGQATLLGGRFYDSVPDDRQLERGGNGLPKPYAVLHMGTIYAQPDYRTITGEEDQPHIMPFSVAVYAATAEVARAAAGAVRETFIGWEPSPSSEPISAPGGSAYRDRDAAGTPTLFVESVGFETTINLGENDGYVPSPGPGAPGGTPITTIEEIIAAYLASHVIAGFERYDFTSPAGQWTAVHSLGRVPDVAIYSPDGTRLYSDQTADARQVVVTWASPRPGFLILT